MAIPGHLRVTPTESKLLFRRAIRGLVPDAVLTRPKRGFEVPLGRWFRGPLRHRIEALRTSSSSIDSFVDRAAVKRLIGEHSVGRRDHSGQLWRLIVLDYWLAALGSGSLGRPPVIPPAPIAASSDLP
jgi:asparagine synthase (glutamine-hydrolysing)